MKKYDSYKDSGIEWIGEIPSHWEVKRIRHIADIFGRIGYRGYTVEDIVFDDTGAISLSPSNIENQKLTLESVTRITEEKYKESPEIMVYENDVVLVKTASVGKAAIVKPLNDLATINPQLVVFKNYRINQTFFYYEIISRIIQDQITQDLNGGVVNTITQTNLNNYSIIVPTPEEQTAIAHYLDRKTAEIDELIADKKRLLELYEEEKTAIINQAVTGKLSELGWDGLEDDRISEVVNQGNPKILKSKKSKFRQMKDSGIEWLGEIPEHWEVKRIRHVAQIFGRIGYRGYKTTDLVSKGEGAITISPSNMKGYFMDFSDCSYLSWEKYDESPEIMIYNGDILFVKTGSTYGKSSLVENLPEKATINPQIIVLKEIQCNNKLLWYIIKSEYTQFQVEGTVVGGTIPTISQAKINNYEFVISPDEKEQQAIVDFIDKECALIDSKKSKTEKLIELLTEYRTALISEVVTGKIKVID